jgi:hypothetical protein
MVHEVDLAVGSLGHLPAGRQVVRDVIALLSQVLQLVALKQGEGSRSSFYFKGLYPSENFPFSFTFSLFLFFRFLYF